MSRLFTIVGLLFIISAIGLFLFQSQMATSGKQPQLSLPLADQSEGIQSAQVDAECNLQMVTAERLITIPTSFDPTIAKCDQYVVSALASTKTFVAFENLSNTGVDSVVDLYSLDANRVFTLDDYGTESVLDVTFLPNNRLLVLYSQGISGSQSLRLYDIPGLEPLLKDVPPEEDLNSETLNPFVFERNLDDATGLAKYLRLTGTAVVLVDENDDITQPVFQIPLEEL